ncbi:hypothetical protein J2S05_001473 [Alkalicoccobacillus murimartini]|uniref:Uncharacterized protein n=1 Tax=Alkalicoccobacillus murimartini TaxID=171685 RepID=A0ABT9YFP2_9BACI|nr:hypothetical protein [Alkalicoccobacillus murimartini]
MIFKEILFQLKKEHTFLLEVSLLKMNIYVM